MENNDNLQGVSPSTSREFAGSFVARPRDPSSSDSLRASFAHYGARSSDFTVRGSVTSRSSALENERRGSRKNSQCFSVTQLEIAAKLDGSDVFKRYKEKPANKIFRWNLLWLVLLLAAPYPLWLTFVSCSLAYEITIVVNVVLTVNFMYATVLCWRYMWRMIRSFNTPFWEELDPIVREQVNHVVVMPTYKEPLELLLETISSVANQTVASSIIMVVGMEEKTPNQEMKKAAIRDQFGQSFKALVFSVHPSGVPGEIAGACSNRNYAARTAVKFMIAESLLDIDTATDEVDLDFTTVTVCDADTTFFNRYFENLAWCFLNEKPNSRYKVCWQSPLFYNIGLDQRWFFTRLESSARTSWLAF